MSPSGHIRFLSRLRSPPIETTPVERLPLPSPLDPPPHKARRTVAPHRPRLPTIDGLSNTQPTLLPHPSTLKSCHICHKAPRQKRDLDSYTDCQLCSRRACYICIRECEAGCVNSEEGILDSAGQKSRTRRKICGSCCVEKGTDGEVWCLDCLEGMTRHYFGKEGQDSRMEDYKQDQEMLDTPLE